MPRSSTKPEMLVRRELHRRGLRFRVNYRRLPGHPDIAFTRARLAVFIDGCFWHVCPQHATMPKNNAGWWREKLERNVARDREKDALLVQLGWEVLHFWEHDDPGLVVDRVETRWRVLLGARGAPQPSAQRVVCDILGVTEDGTGVDDVR